MAGRISRTLVVEAMTHEDTPALVLFALVCRLYPWILPSEADTEHEPVDPILIWQSLQRDYGINTPVEIENKITALITATETDLFFENPQVFRAIVTAVCHGNIDDAINGAFGELSAIEVAMAMHEVTLIRGDECPETSEKVQKLITEEFQQEALEPDAPEVQRVLQLHDQEIQTWLKKLQLLPAQQAA